MNELACVITFASAYFFYYLFRKKKNTVLGAFIFMTGCMCFIFGVFLLHIIFGT